MQRAIETTSERVCETVAETTGRDVLDLPSLYEVIDPEALDRVVESTDGSVCLEFSYCGYMVVIDGRDDISLREQSE